MVDGIVLDRARKRARANLQFRAGDAYAINTLPEGDFDAVCLSAVFHWPPEKTGRSQLFDRIGDGRTATLG